MTKSNKSTDDHIFRINFIPDPYQTAVAQRIGDIRENVFNSWKSLCRVISEMPPNSIQLKICFFYTPGIKNGIQGRLKLWLKVSGSELVSNETIDSLILDGPISEIYKFEKSGNDIISNDDWNSFTACGEIIRRAEKINTYVKKEENDRVPSYYVTLKPFNPNNNNDYMGVDRQLSGLRSPVYIEISVQPVVVEKEIDNLYHYISNLSRINETDYKESKTLKDKHRSEKGFKKDHLADEILRENEELVNNFRKPHIEFYVRVFSTRKENVQLLTSCIAENGLQDGQYSLLMAEKGQKEFSNVMKNRNAVLHDWQTIALSSAIMRLPRLATVDEFSGLFHLPVGSMSSPRTIRKSTDPVNLKDINETILIGDDMETGIIPDRDYSKKINDLFDTPSNSTIEHRISLNNLKKHMFICGVPGSGKTTAMFNLLIQLDRYKIPFFIIEPAKTEYRILKMLKHHNDKNLKSLGERIQVYTPGVEDLSPLRYNPMSFPDGISRDEHINNLMNCFKAAMPMEGPLPALLAEAVEKVYDDFEEPYLRNLVDSVKEVMKTKGYDSEITSNIETAIAVRLSPLVSRSMGKVFKKTDHPVDFAELINKPVVIEMDALDQEQANLLTLFLLTTLREHIKSTRQSGSDLKHVIVLEEAHNIVGRLPEGSDMNDPREKAAQYISRMLAELRAQGEGIIIADQLPSTVAHTVIKNTGTKLAHRLTSMDDREEIGHTMLAGGTEIEEFARLQVGEAFYYSEGLYRCRRIRCINSSAITQLKQPPTNDELYKQIIYESWFKEMAQTHLLQELKDYILYLENELYPTLEQLEKKMKSDGKKIKLTKATFNELVEEYYHLKRIAYEDVNFELVQNQFQKKISKLGSNREYLDLFERFSGMCSVIFDDMKVLEDKLQKLYEKKY